MLPPRSLRQQRGAGLLIAFILIVLISSSLLLANLPSTGNAAASKDAINAEVLEQAKTALIAYAASHSTLPGALPCPDTNGDGQTDTSGSNCVAYLGRLPWRTLSLPTLRDADGECLWYAVSKGYRSALSANSRVSGPKLNDALPGEINLLNSSKASLPGEPLAVAVVFSVGTALPGQNRTPDNSTTCGNNQNAQDYLDTDQGINNANLGNDLAAGNVAQLILANPSTSFNDRATWISPKQLFSAVIPFVLNTLRGSSESNWGIAQAFRDNGNLYPFAAPSAAGNPQGGLFDGWVPYTILGTPSSATKKWLENDDWLNRIGYRITPDQKQATLYYPGPGITPGTEILSGKTFTCSGLSNCP